MCIRCCRAKGFSFSPGILPGQTLREGPPGGLHGGVVAACCSLHPAALAITCSIDLPVETPLLLWLTIMGSGRIDERQERGAQEILQELPVTDQRLWHHSPVIPSTPALGPVTVGCLKRKMQWLSSLLTERKLCLCTLGLHTCGVNSPSLNTRLRQVIYMRAICK